MYTPSYYSFPCLHNIWILYALSMESLTSILSKQATFIAYVPLRGEVDFRAFLKVSEDANVYAIAPRAALDPAEEARKAAAVAGGRPVALLMPGRAFDRFGTRHGQGGGWYDRFLSFVPKEWLRVGFCFEKQFSNERLPKNPWDQSVDFVCVVTDDGKIRAIKTNARIK